MNVITLKANPSIYVGLDVHKKTAQSSAGAGRLYFIGARGGGFTGVD